MRVGLCVDGTVQISLQPMLHDGTDFLVWASIERHAAGIAFQTLGQDSLECVILGILLENLSSGITTI